MGESLMSSIKGIEPKIGTQNSYFGYDFYVNYGNYS